MYHNLYLVISFLLKICFCLPQLFFFAIPNHVVYVLLMLCIPKHTACCFASFCNLYKCYTLVYSLPCLAYVSNSEPCWLTKLYLIHFYSCIVFHYINIYKLFIHYYYWWTFKLFPTFCDHEQWCYKHSYTDNLVHIWRSFSGEWDWCDAWNVYVQFWKT